MPAIILHHGLFGYERLRVGRWSRGYFHPIDAALAADGHRVMTTGVHPTGSIAMRAEQLRRRVLEVVGRHRAPGSKVLLVAHSMGGLDARYMLAKLDMAEHVGALLTVCTPHRGSSYADWCVHHLGDRLGGLGLMAWLKLDVGGIVDVTTERCAAFNETVRDVPGVAYYSISAARPWYLVPAFAIHAHQVIQKAEGDNDGLVSVRSARWGRHLETWAADHWHTVNRRLVLEMGSSTGCIAPYYVRAVQRVMAETDL